MRVRVRVRVRVRLRVRTGQRQSVHFVFSTARPQRSSPGQHGHRVPGHAGKLEGEGPVKQHDDAAEHPLEDGRGVLQDEALLAEEDAAWWGKQLRRTEASVG